MFNDIITEKKNYMKDNKSLNREQRRYLVELLLDAEATLDDLMHIVIDRRGSCPFCEKKPGAQHKQSCSYRELMLRMDQEINNR